MIHEQSTWVDICDVDDIPVRGARIVKTPLGCIALFRTADGSVFALDDRCPHKDGPLSQGIVHGRSVTCPLHNWEISLETGEAEGPDEGRTTAYDVRVADTRVHLLISSKALSRAAEG